MVRILIGILVIVSVALVFCLSAVGCMYMGAAESPETTFVSIVFVLGVTVSYVQGLEYLRAKYANE